MTDLYVGSLVTSPLGGTLALNDLTNYRAESSSRSTRGVTHRKKLAENPYVEGSYLVSSVRENITESVNVFVYAGGAASLRAKIKTLTDCFEQISYTIAWATGDDTEYWKCMAADYTIESSQPLQVAKMALVKASVPRLPTLGVGL